MLSALQNYLFFVTEFDDYPTLGSKIYDICFKKLNRSSGLSLSRLVRSPNQSVGEASHAHTHACAHTHSLSAARTTMSRCSGS